LKLSANIFGLEGNVSSFWVGLIVGCTIGFGGALLFLWIIVKAIAGGEESGGVELFPLRDSLLFRLASGVVLLLLVGGVSYTLKLDKMVAVLLLLSSVLVIARLAGLICGMAASVVGAGLLSILFLPPIGSFSVASSEDRLALVVFLLAAAAGSGLAADRLTR
jgi:hypothetical protein